MNESAFRSFLQIRKLSEDEINQHIAVGEQFEHYLESTAQQPCSSTAREFIDLFIKNQLDTYSNLLALARFGRFDKNDGVYLAVLELLDGGEVMNNFHQVLGTVVGEETRALIFAGLALPTWTTPNLEKARLMRTVMQRFEQLVDQSTRDQILSACLRDLPDEYYQDDKQKFLELESFDRYLEWKREDFLAQLEKIRDEGGLFFNQKITDEVVAFVRADPEISQGVRQGNILFVTKIPYLADEYIHENDPLRKRYYACHCPWARELILRDEAQVSSSFCMCSAGYHKKPWEVFYGQRLQVEVLEAALQGDLRCRFAIHLPES